MKFHRILGLSFFLVTITFALPAFSQQGPTVSDDYLRLLEKTIDKNLSDVYILNSDDPRKDPADGIQLTRLSDLKGIQPSTCSESKELRGKVLCVLDVNSPCGFRERTLAIAASESQISIIDMFNDFKHTGINVATDITGMSNLIGCKKSY